MRSVSILMVLAATCSSPVLAAAGPTETVLYRFPSGIGNPYRLIMDSVGDIYATANNPTPSGQTTCSPNCGDVVKLVPPAPGQSGWKGTILYRFKGGTDGAGPGGLLPDGIGGFYVTTGSGGGGAGCWGGNLFGCGTIAELSPPAPGKSNWTDTVLYSFQGGADGYTPVASLIADNAGNLYTSTAYGNVVEINRPAPGQSAWTANVLYQTSLTPMAGVSADSAGNLYTTTEFGGYNNCNCGTVIKVKPPAAGQSTWTGTVIHRFDGTAAAGGPDGSDPIAGVLADGVGNLYTTTAGGGSNGAGAIVELSRVPGKSIYTETVLYSFQGGSDGGQPNAGLIMDGAGALYTTTSLGGGTAGCGGNCGTIVKLSPPAAGASNWTETVLYRFKGGRDGSYPSTGLIADGMGNLYTTTSGGGGTVCPDTRYNGCGTLVELSGTGFVAGSRSGQ
jgi:hypothetical protein